ncbi:splicing factor, suppressor of white-apricot homolog isoform X1 [Oncorhynchus tshawytscha]|uniref:Splicing factor, suppressor of white-apricot homolog n=1 Tax=Oncorhynchus tshawytscha TaxID=74940 RepID=A0AAZ3SSE4_ONCTS|nr:splicing factor, suppressor of white-apricot homolog isoform X1 [Oncorhynchus tshawytscha]
MYRRGGGKRDHNNKTVKKNESDSKKYAELLVFGYACKLFRDDERAHFHEQGKQLIPWMGDKNILIDRYDGRGHLHDLSEYDAGSWNRDYQLSEEEARIEALCDEERYLAMHTDLLEEEARQEEEYKRLSEALADEGTYNSVGFRYSADYYDPSQPTEEEEANRETEEAEPQESEEPYVAPPGLAIPPDVELPATTKTHAIIERTANFVCQQGAQFEIVLKAKQSGNSQFDFLNFEHYLNPYYKHILKAMKEGRYTPASDKQDSQDSDDSDDDGDGNYLHPSLFAPKKSSRLEELMKPLQVMDPDHPLAALIRKTQQERNGAAAAAAAIMATKPEEVPAEPAVPATPAEYIADPNVAAMYYGYCMLPDGTYCLAPPPPGIDANGYYSSLPSGRMLAPPSYSGTPPPPGTTPPAPPEPSTRIIYTAPPTTFPIIPPPTPVPSQVPVCLSTPSPPAPVIPAAVIPETSSRPQAPVAVPAPVAVAAPAIIPPPPDIQPVIDKLAEYVARNGVKFETSVRAKNDPRFDFLQSWNQYNTYYEFKKNYFMQKEGISLPQRGSSDGLGPAEGEADSGGVGNCPSDKQLNEGKPIKVPFAPICFAIKAKENDMLPLEKNRVRLDDDSDDDPDKLLGEEGLEALLEGAEMVVRAVTATPEEKRPTLTLEELEAKQAKQKLEDRLAAAAREKLAQASKESKEKQLQAERKRKAALFLQTLRNPLTGEPETRRPDKTTAMPEPQLPEVPVAPVVSAPPPLASRAHVYPADQRPHDVSAFKSKEPPSSSTLLLPSSSSTSRRPEKNRDREKGDREKKKKKRKKRSRSRSRSRPKTKHALPSAYRMVRRSRSRSKSPGRRDRRAHSSERRREERERYGTAAYRVGISPALPRRHSRSRSPHEKRKRKSSKGKLPTKGSSCSPSSYPRGTKKSPSASPPTSPTSSLSRDGSQEKEKQVSTAIVSSMQSKITQDLMAKVRAMLASSKTSQPNTP